MKYEIKLPFRLLLAPVGPPGPPKATLGDPRVPLGDPKGPFGVPRVIFDVPWSSFGEHLGALRAPFGPPLGSLWAP